MRLAAKLGVPVLTLVDTPAPTRARRRSAAGRRWPSPRTCGRWRCCRCRSWP
ncbi:hypothetical protein NKH77_41650 [Streptomyces sp. M19]